MSTISAITCNGWIIKTSGEGNSPFITYLGAMLAGYRNTFLLLLLLLLCACREQAKHHNYSDCDYLESQDIRKGPPAAGDWMTSHREPYESITDYINKKPTRATTKRNTLYVVQLGDFDTAANRIFSLAAVYLSAYYQIPVRILPPLRPHLREDQLRIGRSGTQIRTNYILDSLLYPALPDSAFALIAFTLYDLYPGDNWNFVFGQASLHKRVGVWSLARLGDYNYNTETYNRCTHRTLNIAAHETGHMLGIPHCTKYECCMNGSNSLSETDRNPSWLCMESLAKLCWNRDINPVQHLEALRHFWTECLPDSTIRRHYEQSLGLLR